MGLGDADSIADPSQQLTVMFEKVTDSSPAHVWVLTIMVALVAPFVHIGPEEIVPF
jgi:hypothetical protein